MKTKMKINKLLPIMALGMIFASCEYEYDQEYPPADRPVASISPLSVTAAEGETVTFTVTMDKATNHMANFKLETLEGESTAMETDDFLPLELPVYGEFDFGQPGYQVNVQPLRTTFTFDVAITEDIFADNGETAVLKFVSAGTGRAAVQNGQQNITINITNTETYNGSTSEDLGIRLHWSGLASFPYVNADGERVMAEDFELCNLDFDVLIEDPNGVLDYFAATAECPELGILPASDPDGTYGIYVDYYDDAGQETVLAPVAVPLRLTVANIGSADATAEYPELYDISDPVSADEGGVPVQIASIEKSGSTYTVTNVVTGEVFYP